MTHGTVTFCPQHMPSRICVLGPPDSTAAESWRLPSAGLLLHRRDIYLPQDSLWAWGGLGIRPVSPWLLSHVFGLRLFHRKVEDLQFRVEEESITKGDLEVNPSSSLELLCVLVWGNMGDIMCQLPGVPRTSWSPLVKGHWSAALWLRWQCPALSCGSGVLVPGVGPVLSPLLLSLCSEPWTSLRQVINLAVSSV